MSVAILARPPVKTIRVMGGNLFRIALDELGDAEQWERIADLNGLVDPFLTGYVTLDIPSPLPKVKNPAGLA